jgi:hypothetical protein
VLAAPCRFTGGIAMTLQAIKEKYVGKQLNLYLIDGEEVACDQAGTLRFQFKAEIFDDEALDIANNLCKASLKLGENHTVLDIEPLSCEKEIEVLENEFFFIPCDTTEEHYDALSYALMCAVKRD